MFFSLKRLGSIRHFASALFVRSSVSGRRKAPSWRPMLEGLEQRLVPTPGIRDLASFPAVGTISRVIEDSQGNVFGTTAIGGANGDGSVFEVAAGSGIVTTLASFNGTNGAVPLGGLIEDSLGNLFGTTEQGGTGANPGGTVFEVAAGTGTITTLATFTVATGDGPAGGVIQNSGGILFGTTEFDGPGGHGTVFEVNDGTIITLASFNGANGSDSNSGVIQDSNGNLFGTTSSGGANNDGTVFEVAAGSGAITTLASFNGTNGAVPLGGVIEDSGGNLFGTVAGGANSDGTVFEVVAGSGAITTLATFNGTNGAGPSGGVIEDSSGNLFGTTQGGGANAAGTVFEVPAGSGTITTLASFNGANGSDSSTGVIQDSSGNLFGTTESGGANGDGTIFELAIPPVVTSISPQAGPTFGGTTVTISGTYLTGASAVSFGGTPASSFTVNSATQITATAPAEAAGTVDVTVTNPSGTSPTSSADQFTYVKQNTTTALVSSLNPSVYGQSATATATVAPVAQGAGTPTGTVTFSVDGKPQAPVSLVAGQATLNLAALGSGSHTIIASYSGDTNFKTSISGTLAQQINSSGTATALASSVNPSLFGQPVTITATVAPVAPGAGTPTGTITFTVDGKPQAPVTLTAGQATLALGALAAGSHTISASYSGDTNFKTSISGTLAQQINSSSTTTALASSVNPSLFGQPVTITATVAPVAPGAGTPTSTITFTVDGKPQAPVTLTAGQATLALGALAAGSHTITASYSGDTNFKTSISGTLTQQINSSSTTTALASSVNPSLFGQPVTITATVAPILPGAGTPTGTVTFSVDGTAQAPVTLTAGQATLALGALAAGSHTITASYSGDTNFQTSTGTLTQQINPSSTTTALASSVNPAIFGQSVTITATVSCVAPGAGTPTDTVTFSVDGTAQSPVSLAAGQATLNLAALGSGSHTISASYNGDNNFQTSTGTLTQQINPSGTTTTLASSVNPASFGQSVTITTTVAPIAPGAGTPTGLVTFTIDGVPHLPAVSLVQGQATLALTSLGAGQRQIAASYAGAANFAASATSVPFSQQVNAASTITTLSASPSATGQGATITLTVSAPGGVTPTGSATFFVDGTPEAKPVPLDAAGQATLTLGGLADGTHQISASYSGAPNFAASATASSLMQTVSGSPYGTIGTALPLGIAGVAPLVTQQAIVQPTDVDFFAFTVAAGADLSFEVDKTPGTIFDSFLRLTDANGNQLVYNDDGPKPGKIFNRDSFFTYHFAQAGTYYLGSSGYPNYHYNPVTGTDLVNGTTGAYTLTISRAVPFVDPNSLIRHAKFIGPANQIRQVLYYTISNPTDVDMFRFTVRAGQEVTLAITRPDGKLASLLRLFNAKGQQLAKSGGGQDAVLTYRFRSGGTYYVGVSGRGNARYSPLTGAGDQPGSVGDYTITLTPGAGGDLLRAKTKAPAAAAAGGLVYYDQNSDGKREAREPGEGSHMIFIDANRDGIREDGEPGVLSNSRGIYQIPGLAPGKYYAFALPAYQGTTAIEKTPGDVRVTVTARKPLTQNFGMIRILF
jgi:uncharacterized repeat protein (TIGR03803 family)